MTKKGKEIQTRIYLEDWQYAILKDYRHRGMSTLSETLLDECKRESSVSIDTIKTWLNNQKYTNRKPPKGSSTKITTWHIFGEDFQKDHPFNGDKKKMGEHSAARGVAYRKAMKNKKKKADLVRRAEERKRQTPTEMSEDQKKRAIRKLHSDIEKKCKNLKLFGFETACLTFAIQHAPTVVGSPHVTNFLLYECNTTLTRCHQHIFGKLDPKCLKTGSLVSYIRARFSYLYGNALGREKETVPLPYKNIGGGKSVVVVKGLPEGVPVKQPDKYSRAQLENVYTVLGEITVEIETRYNSSAEQDVVNDEVAMDTGSAADLLKDIENGGSSNTEQVMSGEELTARDILEQLANGGSCAGQQELTHTEMLTFTTEVTHEIEDVEFLSSPEVENEGNGDEVSLTQRTVTKKRLPLKEAKKKAANTKNSKGVKSSAEPMKEVTGKRKSSRKQKPEDNDTVVMTGQRKIRSDGERKTRGTSRVK